MKHIALAQSVTRCRPQPPLTQLHNDCGRQSECARRLAANIQCHPTQDFSGIRIFRWTERDAMQQIAVLFARPDSIYKGLPGCDVYDIDRDARNWPGGAPVVAHPPCRAWGRMRQFAKPRDDEKALALLAVAHVREFGGVLEHPAESSLWMAARLPRPGEFPDEHGGWTLEVEQFHFGHRAEKATWLYIVGCSPDAIPPIPQRPGRPTHCIRPSKNGPRLPTVTKAEREKTPADFATWLCMLASRCGAA